MTGVQTCALPIYIVLSGDNAVVIALAARSLPPKQQKQAILWGAGAAVVLRIVLTIFAVALLSLPWLKIIGSLLLFWIGIKLLVPEDDDEDINASDNLMTAIRTILIADLVMSLDNVIAVAAAAGGSMTLLIIGLAVSIPLVVYGATLLVNLMEKYPVIITVGAGLIGLLVVFLVAVVPSIVLPTLVCRPERKELKDYGTVTPFSLVDEIGRAHV